jgi:hypothetical protein
MGRGSRLRGKRLKRLLAPAAILGVLGILAASGLSAGTPSAAAQYQYPKKVVICHHTHSAKNPFVTIVVSRMHSQHTWRTGTQSARALAPSRRECERGRLAAVASPQG